MFFFLDLHLQGNTFIVLLMSVKLVLTPKGNNLVYYQSYYITKQLNKYNSTWAYNHMRITELMLDYFNRNKMLVCKRSEFSQHFLCVGINTQCTSYGNNIIK